MFSPKKRATFKRIEKKTFKDSLPARSFKEKNKAKPFGLALSQKSLFAENILDSEELENRVENHIENVGNLFENVSEALDESLLLIRSEKRFSAVGLCVLVFAAIAGAVARPNSVTLAAAEATLEVTVFVLGAGEKISLIKIGTISTTMATVGNSCAILAGATSHIFGQNAR